MRYVFLDIETTGLDPLTDEITEIGWIVSDTGIARQYLVKHEAQPCEWVLERTDYLTRIFPGPQVPLREALQQLADDCPEKPYLVGANPAFDARFLTRAFARWNMPYPLHYRMVDVETLVMGALKLEAPPSLRECGDLLHLPENPDPHTALADARQAMRVFYAVLQ